MACPWHLGESSFPSDVVMVYLLTYAYSELVHPEADSCLSAQFSKFGGAFKFILPTYALLHFIPDLIFKRKLLMKRRVYSCFPSDYL